MKKKNNYTISSGNVFSDLKVSEPEEMFAKVELAIQINTLIKQRKLTQIKAAELLGIDQPKISLLMQGKLSGFSLERLFKFLNLLGQDITIKVSKTKSRRKSNVIVSLSDMRKPSIVRRPSSITNNTAIHARKKK